MNLVFKKNVFVYCLSILSLIMNHGLLADDEPSIIDILKQDDPSFVIMSENDDYLSSGEDKNYTNSIRFSYSNTHKNDNGKRLIIESAKGPYVVSASMHLANNIYTASDIDLLPSQIPADDRPYAGWTYFGVSKSRVYADDSMEHWEMDIGCIGPCAGSKRIQTEWHKLIGAGEPKGWSTQIKNDLALQYFYDKSFKTISNKTISGNEKARLWFDVSPSVHVEIGTIFDSVGIGGTARLGLMNSYFEGRGLSNMVPKKLPDLTKDAMEKPAVRKYESFLFSRAKLRYMLYNATIEGGLFNNDSPFTQNIRRGVIDIEMGLQIHTKYVSMKIYTASRSTEVKAQPYSSKAHRWGGITIGTHFW